MPVIILVGRAKGYLDELRARLSERFSVVHLSGEYRTIRSRLSNMDSDTAYLVENCDLKPQRYEIFCLARRNETGYCVLSDAELSASKQDFPLFNVSSGLPMDAILECLRSSLICGAAHKRRSTAPNYLMKIKQVVNRVNERMPRGSEIVLNDCESRLMRMAQVNGMELDGLEESYARMVESELRNRGFL
jgi:hypothetical protein